MSGPDYHIHKIWFYILKLAMGNLVGKMRLKTLNNIVSWVFIGNIQDFSNLPSSAYYAFPTFKLHDNSYVSQVTCDVCLLNSWKPITFFN